MLTTHVIATMLNKILFGLLIIFGIFSFNQCSNDVDLYAEYEEITVVYGLLDISDDTSWIKVTRAFSGPGNALLIAQNPDSSNFPYKLDVTITGRKNGVNLNPVQFDTITIHNKKVGDSIFYYPDQLVYYTTGNIDVDANYTLSIKTKENEISAQTPLIDDFIIITPRNRINFDTDNVKFEWKTPANSKRFEVSYVFNYQEIIPGNSDTLNKSLSWFVDTESSEDTDGSEIIEIAGYDGAKFFSKLESELQDENDIPGIKRWAGPVTVYVATGTQVLHNYLSINSVEGSLLEEVPIYTNIDNGTGIFASRHTVIKSVDVSNATLNVLVDMDLGFLFPE